MTRVFTASSFIIVAGIATAIASGASATTIEDLFSRSVATPDTYERAQLREEIVHISPDSAYGHFCKASLTHDVRTALAEYSEAIRIKPSFWEAYFNRATARFAMGEDLLALDDLMTAADLGGGRALDTLRDIADRSTPRARTGQRWYRDLTRAEWAAALLEWRRAQTARPDAMRMTIDSPLEGVSITAFTLNMDQLRAASIARLQTIEDGGFDVGGTTSYFFTRAAPLRLTISPRKRGDPDPNSLALFRYDDSRGWIAVTSTASAVTQPDGSIVISTTTWRSAIFAPLLLREAPRSIGDRSVPPSLARPMDKTRLLRYFEGADEPLTAEVDHWLAESGTAAVPLLLEVLESGDERQGQLAAALMAGLGKPGTDALVKALTSSRRWEGRAVAAFMIGEMGGAPESDRRSTANALLQIIGNVHEDPRVRSKAINALPSLAPGPRAIPILERALADSDSEVRVCASNALKSIKH